MKHCRGGVTERRPLVITYVIFCLTYAIIRLTYVIKLLTDVQLSYGFKNDDLEALCSKT